MPAGFDLAPIQTIEGQPARYFVSLNVYETVPRGTSPTGVS